MEGTVNKYQSSSDFEKHGRPKDKRPAQIQVTAEQLIIEAESQIRTESQVPHLEIKDKEDLAEYQAIKRKDFEFRVQNNRHNIGEWVKYTKWEESMNNFERTRSIFERALDVDYTSANLWIKYAEMEMRHQFINHARNVLDRATQLLPRQDKIWIKYVTMEQQVNNHYNARVIFERWMAFLPKAEAWRAFIKMEEKYNEYDKVRDIFERYIAVHPSTKAWLAYAQFERRQHNETNVRQIYQRAIEDYCEPKRLIAFAEYEESKEEVERARAIYTYALDHLDKAQAPMVYRRYVAFEKQHGQKENIEDVIAAKKRFAYEQQLQETPLDYDTWFDYIALEEKQGQYEAIRDVYERAIANKPPIQEKNYYKRYIYFFIKYAIFEEKQKHPEQAIAIYNLAKSLIPHDQFSFAKLWVNHATCLMRQKQIDKARLLLGEALGRCPQKHAIYKAYIRMELLLGQVDRVRELYARWLASDPTNCIAWKQAAELEDKLGETQRARETFDMAIAQEELDAPEFIWKAFIDFEALHHEHDRVRSLYHRLLSKTDHIKVYLRFIDYETKLSLFDNARLLFQQANAHYKSTSFDDDEEDAHSSSLSDTIKQHRYQLLQHWQSFEQRYGSAAQQASVQKLFPKVTLKSRPVIVNQEMVGVEQYESIEFPEDVVKKTTGLSNLLAKAKAFKKHKTNDGRAVPSSS